MDVETISRDNCCELGKWLHGDGRNRYGKLSIFQTCVHRHAIFHREAGKIAQMINLHQYQQAELAMQEGDYAVASSAVSVAIMQLRQETAANSPK
ncbi:CZB domain-containing protein [Chromobacterium sp. IIBBL 290-4]|nr:CZB domain-containing protein [Chromobacterium sp. IIBBL 290-4]UTH73687.1 CZB domain-containing protein [Chromobacterium sp. IIBBL 290-4]